MKPLAKLLNEMRGRVHLYVGSNSLERLATFLDGYQTALREHGIEYETDPLREFQQVVQWKFKVRISGSWDKIILFYTSGDEEAMQVFWELMDKLVPPHS